MQLFYQPHIEGQEIVLPEEESKHAVRVLRMQEGDTLHLVDGKGSFYEAEIVQAHPKKCRIRIQKRTEQEKRPYQLHLAVAPTKNISRYEWFLEKATEFGVDAITPLLCRNSERDQVKTDRLEKVLIAAMKQSLSAWLPQVQEMLPFSDLIRSDFEGQKFIAHCRTSEREPLHRAYRKGNNALILIGPEGDFTVEEVEEAVSAGFRPVSLGESRLRTETAAIAACHTIHLVSA